MKTIPVYLTVSCLTLLLSACSTPQDRLNRELSSVSTMPPLFQEGYSAGCQSGLFAAGSTSFHFTKDLQKMNQAQYKQGWEDGYKVCQSRQQQRNVDTEVRPSFSIGGSWGHHGGWGYGGGVHF